MRIYMRMKLAYRLLNKEEDWRGSLFGCSNELEHTMGPNQGFSAFDEASREPTLIDTLYRGYTISPI